LLNGLIITLVAILYLIDLAVTLLNDRRRKLPIPAHAQGIYDEAQYAKWLNYSLDTLRHELLTKTVITALLLAGLAGGAFGWLERWSNAWFEHPIPQSLVFLGALGLAGMLLGLPFDYYATFVIEARYGFNKTDQKTFFLDALKGLLLAAVLGGALAAGLQALYLAFAARLWLFILSAWALLSLVMVVLFVLNTKVFVKIFNKLTPLPDGELKQRIQALAGKVGFNLKAISVMDASKRSTKLNAFFSGLGSTREVVLFDTLLEKLTPPQVLAVLAHELGHAVHKDVPRLLAQQIGVFGLYAALLGWVLQSPALAQAFGLSGVHFGFSLVLFGILLGPIELLLSLPLNWLSRQAEFAADAFAARQTGPEPTIGALRTLAQENLANLNPHPLYVLLHYSHPPIPERLEAIRAVKPETHPR
jgi:STE24 endopeptidase